MLLAVLKSWASTLLVPVSVVSKLLSSDIQYSHHHGHHRLQADTLLAFASDLPTKNLVQAVKFPEVYYSFLQSVQVNAETDTLNRPWHRPLQNLIERDYPVISFDNK